MDIYYYQRIFSLNSDLIQLGNFYVDSGGFHRRQVNLISIGEMVQKILFHLLNNNIVITYFIFSLFVLFFWIYLMARFVNQDNSKSALKTIIIISAAILIFFGNYNFIDRNYLFARIISPQISVLLWLIGLVLFNRILNDTKLKGLNYKHLFQLCALIIISSFTYLYTFLILLTTALVVITFLALQKASFKLFWFVVSILLSSLPFLTINYFKFEELRFKDAGSRMGLINHHYPGSFNTVVICFVLIFLIVLPKYISSQKRIYSTYQITLILSSLGVVLASQSNIVTGREIQFYHFSLFAKVNLLLFSIFFVSSLKLKTMKYLYSKFTRIVLVALCTMLTVNTLTEIFLPSVFHSKLNPSTKFLDREFSQADALIVDVPNLQNVFPVYSKAKILFQTDITAYGFTHEELLDRAYISAGCPKQISKSLQRELDVYRTEAIYSKGKVLRSYLEALNLDGFFGKTYKSALNKAYLERKTIESDLRNYLHSVEENQCIEMAQKYGITDIVYDSKSHWYRLVEVENLPATSLTFQGLNLYRYRVIR